MYNVIMVPTDGSGFDKDAIRVGTEMSSRSGAKLELVRVTQTPMVFTGPDTLAYPAEAIEAEREWEITRLDALAAECKEITKSAVAGHLLDGPVCDALARFAESNGVDLIVITTHGRSGFARLALGSVTDKLIRSTKIPVLIVKPTSYLSEHGPKTPTEILVPLDGSELAEQILPRVIELAETTAASVTLLNVLVPHTYSQSQIYDSALPWWEQDIEVARAYLNQKAIELRALGIPTTTDLLVGENVASEILRAASWHRAGLIAIATHGRGALARLARGSVADKLTRTSPTSLLIFHPKMPIVQEDEPAESWNSSMAFEPVSA